MSPPNHSAKDRAKPGLGWKPWIIWALGATSFGFAFFQRVAPSVMVEDLMRDLAVGGAVLGNLSGIYFYAYASLQIPIGALLDRLGPRRMLSAAALIAGTGSLCFAFADSIALAYLGRLLIGIGSAVGLVGTMALVTHWFPPNRFATMTGAIFPFAMVGGMLGQAPLALVVAEVGWRTSLFGAAAFALLLAAASWLIIRDRPPRPQGGRDDKAPKAQSFRALRRDVWTVFCIPRNWILALFAGVMSGPLLAYAGLWGVPHLMQLYDLPRPNAALLTSLMLLGLAIGSPTIGRLSDAMGRRKPLMLLGAGLSFILWLMIFYIPGLPIVATGLLLFAAGFVSSAMSLTFAAVRDDVPLAMSATTIGFVNTATVGAGALLQPIIGLMLDGQWDGAMVNGARIYSLAAYNFAFILLPACGLIGLGTMIFVREGRQLQKSA